MDSLDFSGVIWLEIIVFVGLCEVRPRLRAILGEGSLLSVQGIPFELSRWENGIKNVTHLMLRINNPGVAEVWVDVLFDRFKDNHWIGFFIGW